MALLAAVLASCAGSDTSGSEVDLKLADASLLPAEVRQAPQTVQQAYRFAFANPEILQEIPCYCGCGAMGHTSNYACYVSDVAEDGTITHDTHSLGCSICVDITQDTMRLLKQGKPVAEIRDYVDLTYSRYGPSNLP